MVLADDTMASALSVKQSPDRLPVPAYLRPPPTPTGGKIRTAVGADDDLGWVAGRSGVGKTTVSPTLTIAAAQDAARHIAVSGN